MNMLEVNASRDRIELKILFEPPNTEPPPGQTAESGGWIPTVALVNIITGTCQVESWLWKSFNEPFGGAGLYDQDGFEVPF